MPPHSLLVTTDFSEHARRAALRAGLLAREQGVRRAVLLHAAPASVFTAASCLAGTNTVAVVFAGMVTFIENFPSGPASHRTAIGPWIDL